MKAKDINEFSELIKTCGEIYNREVTTTQVKLYFTLLDQYSIDQVKSGVYRHMKKSYLMPTPIHIINEIKEIESVIQVALYGATPEY